MGGLGKLLKYKLTAIKSAHMINTKTTIDDTILKSPYPQSPLMSPYFLSKHLSPC